MNVTPSINTQKTQRREASAINNPRQANGRNSKNTRQNRPWKQQTLGITDTRRNIALIELLYFSHKSIFYIPSTVKKITLKLNHDFL